MSDLTGHLTDLAKTAQKSADTLGASIERATQLVRETVKRGGTLLFVGNGGSAAEAQHLATEYVVRYKRERRAVAAIALSTDTSLITAHANDYEFETIFSRQIEAIAKKGDLLYLATTSGNSPNLLRAADAAKKKGVTTLAISGKGGGKLAALVDHCVVIPSDRTDRTQEISLAIGHAICDAIDAEVN